MIFYLLSLITVGEEFYIPDNLNKIGVVLKIYNDYAQDTVEISRLNLCRCARIIIEKRRLAQGDSTRIYAYIDLNNKPDTFVEHLYLRMNKRIKALNIRLIKLHHLPVVVKKNTGKYKIQMNGVTYKKIRFSVAGRPWTYINSGTSDNLSIDIDFKPRGLFEDYIFHHYPIPVIFRIGDRNYLINLNRPSGSS